MAASQGVDNWNKNWKGRGNISTFVKVNSATLYEEDGSRSGVVVTKGLPVTYLDNQSGSHTRVAIQVGEKVFLTNIDNLQKPQSIGRVDLKPQAFGLGGSGFTLLTYLTKVKSAINSRDDIKGDLKDYLLDLVKQVEFGSNSITGYDLSELPMGSILSDFGEVLGPIFCIKTGLSKFNLGVNQTSTIFFPATGTEPLLDYLIKTSKDTYKISAKAKGTSNTLKMNNLVPSLLSDNTFIAQISDIMNPDYFESDSNKFLVKSIMEYFVEYKTVPTLEVLKIKTDEIQNDVLKVAVVESLKESWRYIEATDLQFVKEKVLDFCIYI